MKRTLTAGVAYFALVFAVGFALGTLRVLLAVPLIGETAAVVAELPIMLAISWLTNAALVRRLDVPPHLGARASMGLIALALLLAAEAAVSVLGFGRSLVEHVTAYRSPGAALGLAAQLLFAAFPCVQLATDRRASPGRL